MLIIFRAMDSTLQESSWQSAAHPVQPGDYRSVEESAILHYAHQQVHTLISPSLCQAVPCLWLWLLQAAGASGGCTTCPAGRCNEQHTVFFCLFFCSVFFFCQIFTFCFFNVECCVFAHRSWAWVPNVSWPWLIELRWSASPKTCSNCSSFRLANKWQSGTLCRLTTGQSTLRVFE